MLLLKWGITLTIVYFIYKYYIKPNVLDQGEDQTKAQIHDSKQETGHEDEYIDYEEVE